MNEVISLLSSGPVAVVIFVVMAASPGALALYYLGWRSATAQMRSIVQESVAELKGQLAGVSAELRTTRAEMVRLESGLRDARTNLNEWISDVRKQLGLHAVGMHELSERLTRLETRALMDKDGRV